MNEIDRIQDQLRRAFEGDAWHGPSVREVLDGVDAARAAARPIPDGHSIWELTLHLITWEAVVASRIRGATVDVADAMDWPAVGNPTESAWRAAREALESGHRDLVAAIAEVSPSRLDEKVGTRTMYLLMHGIVQHDLYHAGQIALLRKARAKRA